MNQNQKGNPGCAFICCLLGACLIIGVNGSINLLEKTGATFILLGVFFYFCYKEDF